MDDILETSEEIPPIEVKLVKEKSSEPDLEPEELQDQLHEPKATEEDIENAADTQGK